jgi:peptide-methionine (S)-S-oxide reductase
MAPFGRKRTTLPSPNDALRGRDTPLRVADSHFVTARSIKPPFPADMEEALFGLGCFWGAERRFWETDGVWTTAAGYAGGYTPNPTYEEVCSGETGHTEAVLVVFDPEVVTYDELLAVFWEAHDPTQGMRQGNDVGTQYRSLIGHTTPAQEDKAKATLSGYQDALSEAGYGPITTEIVAAPAFHYAEEHHQQYLAKNPHGYCGLGGTGVPCPTGLTTAD